ncbi:hypothetical protein B0H15DRAFT_987844 [Mycena belliarum]|uniref:Uncharacterized protein n=1 Tax=Mycena belliarum TaxID=1033014 RepID=A0AAD6U291_9AGAR|nr:hypothetical protein B0H15DRAFT_987844 [Mycena belliae]
MSTLVSIAHSLSPSGSFLSFNRLLVPPRSSIARHFAPPGTQKATYRVALRPTDALSAAYPCLLVLPPKLSRLAQVYIRHGPRQDSVSSATFPLDIALRRRSANALLHAVHTYLLLDAVLRRDCVMRQSIALVGRQLRPDRPPPTAYPSPRYPKVHASLPPPPPPSRQSRGDTDGIRGTEPHRPATSRRQPAAPASRSRLAFPPPPPVSSSAETPPKDVETGTSGPHPYAVLALPAEDDDDDEHRPSPSPPPPTPLPKGPQHEDQDVRAIWDASDSRAVVFCRFRPPSSPSFLSADGHIHADNGTPRHALRHPLGFDPPPPT